jgi:hypothetical protein
MKKYFILSAILISAILIKGCEIDPLPFNIPISVPLSYTGPLTSIVISQDFCMEDFSSYSQHTEDLNKITFLESAFRVDSVSPPNLTGSLGIELKTSSGQTVFNKQIQNFTPADYTVKPYIIPIEAAEIETLNNHLLQPGRKCFTAVVSLTGITGGFLQHHISGYIDMVFEAEVEL